MTAAAPHTGRVHVVGAGLAGLAAAVALAGQGRAVTLHESGTHAGGRCRSFHDAELGCRIDNGNHLLLTGNTAALAYIDQIGALDTFEPPAEAAIPFIDLVSGERWAIRPSRGAVPWWILSARRRVPGTRARDYLDMLKLWRAAPEDTLADALAPDTVLFRRLWEPLAVAALNTGAAEASAPLFRHLLTQTIGRGAAACRPLLARQGLSESLVDPALAFLRERGCEIRYGARLRAIEFGRERVTQLGFDGETQPLGPTDSVVLAVPAAIAARLVPGLIVPDDYAPIVNGHFRYDLPPDAPPFLGVVGGTAEWVFRKPGIASVTVSAADRIVDRPAEELREVLWRDVTSALGLPPSAAPAARIVKERRATFRATPAQLKRRPAAATKWNNLQLAGDYVDTGLPATIEGAIRSGFAAATQMGQRSCSIFAATPVPASPPQSPANLQECQRALP
ncbi:MAG TPA: hydroxysqualene dehydroxylase HpnE [Stellaceae bacterium]|nr:hydroxysqualene dehydroxylase HpnE [Stellaceae bacterium]